MAVGGFSEEREFESWELWWVSPGKRLQGMPLGTSRRGRVNGMGNTSHLGETHWSFTGRANTAEVGPRWLRSLEFYAMVSDRVRASKLGPTGSPGRPGIGAWLLWSLSDICLHLGWSMAGPELGFLWGVGERRVDWSACRHAPLPRPVESTEVDDL